VILEEFTDLAMFGVTPHWLKVDGEGVAAIEYLRRFLFDLTTGPHDIWQQPESLVPKTGVVARSHSKVREIDHLRTDQTLFVDNISNLPWQGEEADWGTLMFFGPRFLALGQALPLLGCC
jgi:hypothetical protein